MVVRLQPSLSARAWTTAAVAAFVSAPGLAQEAETQQAETQVAETQAMSLDELLGLPGQDAVPGAENSTAPAEPDTPRDPVEDVLNPSQASEAFEHAVQAMSDVAGRIGGQQDLSLDTQRRQQDILDKLDQVIATARRSEQQGGGGSGSGQPSGGQQRGGSSGSGMGQQANAGSGQQVGQPVPLPGNPDGANTQGGSGTAQADDLDDTPLEVLRQRWGQLPPRVRDQVMQGMDDHVSSVYRTATEAYFERLAELMTEESP